MKRSSYSNLAKFIYNTSLVLVPTHGTAQARPLKLIICTEKSAFTKRKFIK